MKKMYEFGYILPATIMLGLGISILSATYMQIISTTGANLNTRNYNTLAAETARAGITYAIGCVKGGTSSWSAPLTPITTCSGSASGNASNKYITDNGEWRSTFTVNNKDSQNNIVSTGTVEQRRNGVTVQTYTATAKVGMTETFNEYQTSIGESITAIKNDRSNCAIANGKLYCWGDNSEGQLGVGDRVNRSQPTLVGGALAGKTVTKVSVAYTSVCAIADGQPYCWGNNTYDQLGCGNATQCGESSGDVLEPRTNVPRTSSGPLAGKTVIDIGTASQNSPANWIWPWASTQEHSCALTEDGAVSCWGYGDYRQLTGGGLTITCHYIVVCLTYYDYPPETYPTLVKGYRDNTGPFTGKKAERVGASSHDSCILAEGKMYCWGVPAPLNPICYLPPTGQFSGSRATLIPLNPCIGSYSNGYNVSAIGVLPGKFIDASTWDVSANEGCMMANTDYICFGATPAFNYLWLDAMRAPWVAIANSDVTDSDNGDNIASGGTSGLYCAVDRGVAKCAGSVFLGTNQYTGTGSSGQGNFKPLIRTGSNSSHTDGLNGPDGQPDTMDDLIPTKIAAGQDFGCVVANGQLLCWGDGANGVLADGSTSTSSSHKWNNATVTGTTWLYPNGDTGSTKFGTTSSDPTKKTAYAASGSVSVGGDHACGVANGRLFCWGKNDQGQLGIGTTGGAAQQPRAVSGLDNFKSITKVSAGKSHTCAIAYGSLYCWGENGSGQLGIDSTTDQNKPTLVSDLANMRVTDVSTGDATTCAIANGQAYCWGEGSQGQIGDGTPNDRDEPRAVSGGGVLTGKSVTSISTGLNHTCAVANGDLYCWGNNSHGQLGDGTTTSQSSPKLIATGTANEPKGPNNMRPLVTKVSAGNNFTCAIINANVSCWGDNSQGQLGRGYIGNTAPSGQPSPRTPANLNSTAAGYYATDISAGSSHACALLNGGRSLENGNLYCWGMNIHNQVSAGSTASRPTPVRINSGATENQAEIAVDVGSTSSCSVANGKILCWGDNSDGRLGGVANTPGVPSVTSNYRDAGTLVIGPIF